MNKRQFLTSGLAGISAITASKLQALEYYPMPSDKKWAIIYGTWCGSSRDAAVWISEGMGGIAQVFDVRENPDISKYQHVVIGGAIRGGKVSDDLQSYIIRNKKNMSARLRALFAVCGNRMQPVEPQQKAELIDNHLAAICGVKNLPSRVFLGRITYSLMDEESRNMLKGFKMPEYDNLKRPECMDFGKEILASSLPA